jgi:hypothetical protein
MPAKKYIEHREASQEARSTKVPARNEKSAKKPAAAARRKS